MKQLTFKPNEETSLAVEWPDEVSLARYRARRTWLTNRWRATEYRKRVDAWLEAHKDRDATWNDVWEEIDAHELPEEEYQIREEWTDYPYIVGTECVKEYNGEPYEPATMPEARDFVTAVGLSVLAGTAKPLLADGSGGD